MTSTLDGPDCNYIAPTAEIWKPIIWPMRWEQEVNCVATCRWPHLMHGMPKKPKKKKTKVLS